VKDLHTERVGIGVTPSVFSIYLLLWSGTESTNIEANQWLIVPVLDGTRWCLWSGRWNELLAGDTENWGNLLLCRCMQHGSHIWFDPESRDGKQSTNGLSYGTVSIQFSSSLGSCSGGLGDSLWVAHASDWSGSWPPPSKCFPPYYSLIAPHPTPLHDVWILIASMGEGGIRVVVFTPGGEDVGPGKKFGSWRIIYRESN
jgi:hypothetical protein